MIRRQYSDSKMKTKKIAVFFHLYYEKQTDFFLDLFKNLNEFGYDLFVTLSRKNRELTDKIKRFKEDAKIYVCENRGYDVGPFFYALNKVNLDDYEYIIKLHTKNTTSQSITVVNGYPLNDKQFSESLLKDLLGTREQINQNIKILDKNSRIGMLGSSVCLTGERFFYERFLDEVNKILITLHLKPVKTVKCVSGTMFIARSECFKILQNKIDITDFDKTSKNIKDGTLAHVCERLFGALIQAQNYKVKGTGFEKRKYILQKLKRKLYKEQISSKGNFTAQFLFFPIYRKNLLSNDEKLLLKSDLFDTYWYFNRYLRDIRRKYFPVRHYLRIGWKKGFDPSEKFSTNSYLRAYPEVLNTKMNPLLHWLKHGKPR